MIALNQQVRPYSEVVDTELDTGETILLQLESTTYYSLNTTGTRIWQGLKRGLDPAGDQLAAPGGVCRGRRASYSECAGLGE